MTVTKRKTIYGLISIPLIFALLQTGCSQNQPSGVIANAPFLDGLFVTRPDVDEPMLTVLRLKNSALMETAQRKDGVLQIDKKLLAAIEKEQETIIAQLQKISPDIRVLIRYKLVLNGLALWIPEKHYEEIQALVGSGNIAVAGQFSRPQDDKPEARTLVGKNTSVNFIGSQAAHELGHTGKGMRVGVIDTGIDYTHAMFLGEGTAEAYKAIDPNLPHPSFPNKKIVGGIDLVGTAYSSGAADPNNRIPKPDANPLDEGSHGTHVAGSVAGIGDGVNTYSGVAPEADLYAIKVFGAKGSTTDAVVIAALEYSIDPTGDLSFKEQLDVVNLSLGGGYGNPNIMYNEAVKNTVKAGTVVVAAAGNNGDISYVTGAPAVSNEAISVASSIDNQTQNIAFPAVQLTLGENSLTAEAIEAAVTKKISEFEKLEGPLVDIGLADADLSPELAEKVRGKIALSARGGVSFAEKIERAQKAGAIAVIVTNNSEEAPIVMGGEGSFDIPAIMISLKDGQAIREHLKTGTASADLKTTAVIEKPWLADTISPFSSRGPRSSDGIIKPEVAAPGSNIISANVGTGNQGKPSSGTSMASPHIAGVVALLKQKFPDLATADFKSVLLNSSKTISDPAGKQYPVSRQGAGRVQVAEALKTQVIASPAALSFGITDVVSMKSIKKTITLKNIHSSAVQLTPAWKGSPLLNVTADPVVLAPGETKTISVIATLSVGSMKDSVDEADGYLTFVSDDGVALKLPALAVVRKISDIDAEELVVRSSGSADAAGSAVDLQLINRSVNDGEAFLFNLLGVDSRKHADPRDATKNRLCDLQSSGYRVIVKKGQPVLQVALKLFEGQTTWHTCEVNVQIDSDGDNVTDQEIAGLPMNRVAGLAGETFVSVLLDGDKARQLRKDYEASLAKDPSKAAENYAAAVVNIGQFLIYNNGTLAVLETPVSALKLSRSGGLHIKVSTTHQDSGVVEYDNYLADHKDKWRKISIVENGQGYFSMPEKVLVPGNAKTTVSLTKGYGHDDLIVYSPMNSAVQGPVLEDRQSVILKPAYRP